MKILIFSLGVVFKNTVQGGSQKVLRDICIGLSLRGHEIVIICPTREDNNDIFEICPNVVVKPVLPLRGVFPMPYAVSPFSLAETCRMIEEEVSNADIMYCHDGGLNIDFLKNRIPTVISLRDFCYPETLLGALNFREKAVVVNSMHTYLCLQDTFARVNPELRGKAKIIYNGYNPKEFERKHITSRFYEISDLPKKSKELIIGFPHRPEMEKGFANALRVLKLLEDTWGSRVKLLVPVYMDHGMSARTDETYKQIRDMIEDLKLQNSVIYHTWICHESMPEYYSYCDLVLCIGNFVESFSNVSVESLLCKTPVIVANTSTYRTMPILQYLNIVPYGDIEKTAQVADRLLRNKNNEKLEEARRYISNELTIDKMVNEYEKVFSQALEGERSVREDSERFTRMASTERYKLAPWCEERDGEIYDDYRYGYFKYPFKELFCDSDAIYTRRELISQGISEVEIDKAVSEGVFVVER